MVGDTNLADGKGNQVYNNTNNGIWVNSGSATVAGNTVYGQTANGDWGIYASSNAVNIASNVVYGNNQGIYEADGWSGSITNNLVYNNAAKGIYAYSVPTVSGNVVYGNALGMELAGFPNGTQTARNNLVYGNSQNGVVIDGAGVAFDDNTVDQQAGDAVSLNGASQTTLYDNILGSSAAGGFCARRQRQQRDRVPGGLQSVHSDDHRHTRLLAGSERDDPGLLARCHRW